MLRKLLTWFLFAVCLAFFGLGTTPLGPMADSALIALKIIILIFLSVLIVRSNLARWSASHARGDIRVSDHGESILRSFTRWCRGERKPD
jgi:hypothetical protein